MARRLVLKTKLTFIDTGNRPYKYMYNVEKNELEKLLDSSIGHAEHVLGRCYNTSCDYSIARGVEFIGQNLIDVKIIPCECEYINQMTFSETDSLYKNVKIELNFSKDLSEYETFIVYYYFKELITKSYLNEDLKKYYPVVNNLQNSNINLSIMLFYDEKYRLILEFDDSNDREILSINRSFADDIYLCTDIKLTLDEQSEYSGNMDGYLEIYRWMLEEFSRKVERAEKVCKQLVPNLRYAIITSINKKLSSLKVPYGMLDNVTVEFPSIYAFKAFIHIKFNTPLPTNIIYDILQNIDMCILKDKWYTTSKRETVDGCYYDEDDDYNPYHEYSNNYTYYSTVYFDWDGRVPMKIISIKNTL